MFMISPTIARWLCAKAQSSPEEPEVLSDDNDDHAGYSPCHWWGDDWPYWDDLYAAERYLYKFTKRWSRCSISTKEKYGTIRYEWIFPPWSGVFYHSRIQGWWVNYSWLHRKWARYGKWVLGLAVQRACKKWPQVKNELLDDWEWFNE